MSKLVTCNGCFDGLTPGHLFLFGFCLAKGDELILGINSDDYIINNKKKPLFFNEEQRRNILLELGIFKEVIIFYEDDPCEFIKKTNPHVHCIGSDHPYPPEKQLCESIGIEFYFIPRIEKWASSKLRKDLVSEGINF